MDEMLYNAYTSYFHALEKLGYMSSSNVAKLLVFTFYRDAILEDFRGRLSQTDYCLIDRALECIYGSTCLIPYPDYLKMHKAYLTEGGSYLGGGKSFAGGGKLYIGDMTEMATRVKTLEDTNVVKVIHNLNSVDSDVQSDVMIVAEEG